MYAELHCHSNFSFLDGASHPEELAEEAARLGLAALAITDHDGFYGIVRFAEAARALALPTVFGTELTLGAHGVPNGTADPPGEHLIEQSWHLGSPEDRSRITVDGASEVVECWRSEVFGAKRPGWAVRVSRKGVFPIGLATSIRLGEDT